MTDKEKTHAPKRLCGKSSAGVLLTIVLIIYLNEKLNSSCRTSQ